MRIARRIAPVVAAFLVSACGLVLGIDTDLDVKVDDAGDAAPATDSAVKESGADVTVIDVDAGVLPPKRPPQGTYVYDVTGYDRIYTPFGSPRQDYGPTASIRIEHILNDCFEMTFTFRTNYTEMMRMCIVGIDVVHDIGLREQTFPVGSASTTLKCKAPGDFYFTSAPNPGTRLHDCEGGNTDSKSGGSTFTTRGLYQFKENIAIDVKGKLVMTKHFYDGRLVTGAQTGTNNSDWFFSEEGVLQHFVRKVDVDYQTGFGKVTYEERVDMTLSARPDPVDAGTD